MVVVLKQTLSFFTFLLSKVMKRAALKMDSFVGADEQGQVIAAIFVLQI